MIKLIILLTGMLAASKLMEDSGAKLDGSVMGVPYDLRVPTVERIKERNWNPDDPRLFTPMAYGVGWTINFLALLRTLRLCR